MDNEPLILICQESDTFCIYALPTLLSYFCYFTYYTASISIIHK